MYPITTLLDEFLAAKAAGGSQASTMRTYRYHLNHFVGWLGDRSIDRATDRAYQTHLTKTKTNPITINGYLRDMSTFCSWLVAEGELEVNPALQMKQKIPKRRPASYSRDHIRALLKVATLRDKALVLVLLDTGLRVSELVQLRRDSFDRDGHFSIVGKGNKERSGWLSPYALKVVGEYLASRKDAQTALFIGRLDRPMKPGAVHHAIDLLAQKAGIRDQVRRLIHSFRATFAKNWRKRQGDLASLAELMGHSTLAMAQYYSQLADDELGELKNKINPLAVDVEEAA
jgi:site-specific recombinase XerD